MKPKLRYQFQVLILFLSLVNFSGAYSQNPNYLAVIDAGSSGSRIFLFSWTHLDAMGIPNLAPVRDENGKEIHMKTDLGLSDSVQYKEPSDAASSLEPLLSFVKTHLSSEALANTSIILNATAGMRLISSERSDAILDNARKLFVKHGFKVSQSPEKVARIIDEDSEGIYGWIGVNFLLGNLTDSHTTTGVLDLSGASTKITYASNKTEGEGITNIKIGEKEFHVFTHSFLGLGLNKAFQKLATQDCLPIKLPSPLGEGTGSFENCLKNNQKRIMDAVIGNASLLKPIDDEMLSSNFLLIGGYYYTYEYLKGLDSDSLGSDSMPQTWKEMLVNNGTRTCTLSSEQQLRTFPAIPKLYIDRFCFNSAYILALLEKYGFNEKSSIEFKQNLEFKGHSVEIGWHVGAALQEAIEISRNMNLGKDKQFVSTKTKTPEKRKAHSTYKNTTEPIGMSKKHGKESTVGNPMTFLKLQVGISGYQNLTDPSKIWDLNSALGMGVQLVSPEKLSFSDYLAKDSKKNVGTDKAIGMDYLPFFTVAAVIDAHKPYDHIPMVDNIVNKPLHPKILKRNLGKMQESYDWKEFQNLRKQSRPYLVCNFYKTQEDLLKGASPLKSDFVNRKDLEGDLDPIFANEELNIPSSSYYNDWILLKGRWVQINNSNEKMESMSGVRFASIDNPFSLMEMCSSVFMKNGTISTPITQNIYNRIAPQARYLSDSISYPIAFYVKINEKTENGVRETARLILRTEENEAQTKADYRLNKSNILASNLIRGQSVVKNYSTDNLKKLFSSLISTRRTYDPMMYEHLEKLNKAHISANTLYKSYQASISWDLEDLVNPSKNLEATSSLQSLHKPIVGVPLTDAVQGKSLSKLDEIISLRDLFDLNLVQESYIACKYYGKSEHDQNKPAEAAFSLSPSAEAFQQNGFDSRLTLQGDRIVPKTKEVFNPFKQGAIGAGVLLKGRWANTNGGYVFATLADPIHVQSACIAALDLQEKAVPVEFRDEKKENITDIATFAGNTPTSINHPIVYYIPIRIDGVPKAIRFNEGVVPLAEKLGDKVKIQNKIGMLDD